MHARSGMLVFVLGSMGCHNCGHDSPKEESDTDPFAESDGCGFICTSDGSSSSFTAAALDDTSAESSSGTTGAIGPQDECAISSECGRDSFCVAPFDQALGPEGKGAYACVSECVPLVDEDLWCADATACCDPEAVCTDRGYCELPGSSTGTGDTGGSDNGTGDTGSDTGGRDTGDDSGTGSSG